jgi:cell division protein FtsL
MAKGVARSRAKRSARPGTRSLIALVLVGFVLMATGVIARRVLGVSAESTIRRLRERRDGLEAERIRLEGAIREASSRARLQPIAEQRLNMHIPSPDQQVLLARPTNQTTPSPQRTP